LTFQDPYLDTSLKLSFCFVNLQNFQNMIKVYGYGRRYMCYSCTTTEWI